MYNPYLNESNATEITLNKQFSQTSISNQHLQQIHQEQQDLQPKQHEDYQPRPVAKNEKHILYIDDYTDTPPSYSVSQENHQILQTSDVDTRVASFPNSIEEVPLDPYHAYSPTEPETAPLIYEQNEHIIQPGPLVDRVEVGIYNSFNKSRRVHQCSITKLILGFAIFAFGITLMATALVTIKCYSQCEEESCQCESKTHKGVEASGLVFFILTSLCILWKIIKFAVH